MFADPPVRRTAVVSFQTLEDALGRGSPGVVVCLGRSSKGVLSRSRFCYIVLKEPPLDPRKPHGKILERVRSGDLTTPLPFEPQSPTYQFHCF